MHNYAIVGASASDFSQIVNVAHEIQKKPFRRVIYAWFVHELCGVWQFLILLKKYISVVYNFFWKV